MKKIIIASVIAAFLIGCGETKTELKAPVGDQTKKVDIDKPEGKKGGASGVSAADLKVPGNVSAEGTNDLGSKSDAK